MSCLPAPLPINNNNNNNNNEYLWSAPSSTLGGSARRFTEEFQNKIIRRRKMDREEKK